MLGIPLAKLVGARPAVSDEIALVSATANK